MRNDMIERPAGRYGPQRLSRSNRRWIAVGLGVLVLAAGIGIAVMAAQRLGTGEVKGELGGYHLVDDETVQVTITVTRRGRWYASCGRARSTAAKRAAVRCWFRRRRRRPCR